MNKTDVVRAWGKILTGARPALSIEITRECPLRCPGCYAYGDEHLGGGVTLRQLSDFKGDELVQRVLALVDEYRPLHVSIVGGEPLVRYREVTRLLPELTGPRDIKVQVVTSAVRRIPLEWQQLNNLTVTVSIDGLAPEHDVRRTPATYERILQNISGLESLISVHCTITSQIMRRPGYLREFVAFWSPLPAVRRIWFSFFTPQIGETSEEILTQGQRRQAVEEMYALRREFPKLDMTETVIKQYLNPPKSPKHCTFAQTTHTFSADLKTMITPCQFGGNPDCSQCGCIASMGFEAVAAHKLAGPLTAGHIFRASLQVGRTAARIKSRFTRPPATPPGPLVQISATEN